MKEIQKQIKSISSVILLQFSFLNEIFKGEGTWISSPMSAVNVFIYLYISPGVLLTIVAVLLDII